MGWGYPVYLPSPPCPPLILSPWVILSPGSQEVVYSGTRDLDTLSTFLDNGGVLPVKENKDDDEDDDDDDDDDDEEVCIYARSMS
jgi:hypothetical protein